MGVLPRGAEITPIEPKRVMPERDITMKRIFAITAALAGFNLSLYAGDGVSATEDTLFYTLQAIEVIAARTVADAGLSATVFNEDRIKKENFGMDIPSLLRFSPSVVSSTENGIGLGGSSIRIRGIDQSRINVSVNGMPLNDPDSHSMYWYDTPDLCGNSGRIQVVRGAGTTACGTAALGGSVNIATSSLKESFAGDVSLSLGAFNTNRQCIHVGSGLLGGRWIADLRLSHASTDGYVDRGFTNMTSYMFQGGYFDGGTMIKLLSFGGKTRSYLCYTGTTPGDINDYGPTYHCSGQYRTSDGPFVLKDGTHVAYFNDQTDNYLQINNQLILDHQFPAAWKTNAMLFYSFGQGYYRQYKDDAWLMSYDNLIRGDLQADLIRRKMMTTHKGGATANALFGTERLNLVFGASYMFCSSPHYGTIDWIDGIDSSVYGNFRWYDNGMFKNDGSIYAKADFSPVSNLSLHAELQLRMVGYRVWGTNDNYDWTRGAMQNLKTSRFWAFFNPVLSASYQINRFHSIGGSFSSAGKEPSRSDFTDRYNFSSLAAEPESERLYDWELYYLFRHAKIEAGATLYWMQYRNQLVPTGIVNDSEDNLNVNVKDSFRRGLELDLKVSPLEFLSIGADCTLSQNRIQDFDETVGGVAIHHDFADIAYSPSVLAGGFASFRSRGFEATVKIRYTGSQYVSNGSHEDLSLPAYFTGDVLLSYTIPRRIVKTGIRIGLKISNFTNTRYSSYGYGYSYFDGDERKSVLYLFPQAPCNCIGSIDISF